MREDQKDLTMAQDEEVRRMVEGVFDKDKIKIENPEDWATMADDIIKKGIIHEVDSRELEDVKLMWRGMDPQKALGLVFGTKSSVSLFPRDKNPNATLDWRKAIAYNRGKEDSARINAALGFVTEADWEISPAAPKLSKDTPEEAQVYHRGNFIINGELYPRDLRYVIIRFWGKKIGKVPEPIVYEIDWKKLVEMQNGREETANK